MTVVKCEECPKQFNKLPSAIKRTNHNFCSRSCAATFNGRKRKGPYFSERRNALYSKAAMLREEEYSYHTIGQMIDIPWSTVSKWVKSVPHDSQKVKERIAAKKRSTFEEAINKGTIRKILIRERGHKCEGCSRVTWIGQPIPIELHRMKKKSYKDCSRNELKLLCNNCHALTFNWKGKR